MPETPPSFRITGTRTLSYRGQRNLPSRGSIMGPDASGLVWLVEGARYSADDDQTYVHLVRPETDREVPT